MDEATTPDLTYDPAGDDLLVERPRSATALIEQKNRILANWAVRVATQPTFRAMPNLSLEEIQRDMAGVLDGAIAAVATSSESVDPALLERAVELAAAHGHARAQEHFGIGDVLTEFFVLRHEVWITLLRGVEPPRVEGERRSQLRMLGDRLADVFDLLAISAAEAWAAGAQGAKP